MVLQQLAEEVTQFNEDLGQEQRRALLSALIGALDAILPFLCSTIQTSLAAAMDAAQRQDFQLAAAHGSVVQAACGTMLLHPCVCQRSYSGTSCSVLRQTLHELVIVGLGPILNAKGWFAGHACNDLCLCCRVEGLACARLTKQHCPLVSRYTWCTLNRPRERAGGHQPTGKTYGLTGSLVCESLNLL